MQFKRGTLDRRRAWCKFFVKFPGRRDTVYLFIQYIYDIWV